MNLLVLGRQPEISYAELLSLYGDKAQRFGQDCALIDGSVDFSRLGGSLKLAKVVHQADHPLDPDTLADTLANEPALLARLPEGKAVLGLSFYGRSVGQKQLFRLGLELKKRLRTAGHSVRIVPSENRTISAAQILHNRMIDNGADIVIAEEGHGWTVALTDAVQDIEAYSARDYGRPGRSAKVGMLPPKLAQIMINLAAPQPGATVLDPFCGTGVVLQELVLMGFKAVGSDISPEMVGASKENLTWLGQTHDGQFDWSVSVADARQLEVDPVEAVVTEGYLGPPLTSPPSPEQLGRLKTEIAELALASLENLHSCLKPGAGVVMCLPAWKQPGGYEHLDIVDQIQALGYTFRRFESVRQSDLLYLRPDQIVARELIILTKV